MIVVEPDLYVMVVSPPFEPKEPEAPAMPAAPGERVRVPPAVTERTMRK